MCATHTKERKSVLLDLTTCWNKAFGSVSLGTCVNLTAEIFKLEMLLLFEVLQINDKREQGEEKGRFLIHPSIGICRHKRDETKCASKAEVRRAARDRVFTNSPPHKGPQRPPLHAAFKMPQRPPLGEGPQRRLPTL